MKSIADVVSGAGLAGYAEVALLIFFLVFVALGLRVVLAGKQSFRDVSRLPFDDEGDLATRRLGDSAVKPRGDA